MHSHLITFTGPITTTYSQIAPNLLPSPDCSPEPKVGNTTSCTTTQIYPWGIAGFPAEPTPSRVPRAVSRAPPPPPTPVAEARGQDFPSRISGGSGWSFPSLVPSGPFHHPCGATPAKLPWRPACWFSRKPWQAGQGKGGGCFCRGLLPLPSLQLQQPSVAAGRKPLNEAWRSPAPPST